MADEIIDYELPDEFHEAVTFTSQPTPPYYYVDTWVNGDEIYTCCHERTDSESFNTADWVLLDDPTIDSSTISYRTVTQRSEEYITDFSEDSLATYQESGAIPYAVYDDGTEVQVTWSEVHDPSPEGEEFVTEAEQMALANNQHFWYRTTATDGAGTGALVTDEEQDEFLSAAASNFPDLGESSHTDIWTGDGTTRTFTLSETAGNTNYAVRVGNTGIVSGITKTVTSFTLDTAPAEGVMVYAYYATTKKPWHNILLNSLGIALRMGFYDLATITKSAIAFYDGDGNASENVLASFGAQGAQIGKSSETHTVIDSSGVTAYNGDGTVAPMVARLNGSYIDDSTIANSKIVNSTITGAKISDAAITEAKIDNAAVTTAKIDDAAITTAKIDNAAITTATIADNAVSNEKVNSLSANKLTAGTIDASSINVANLRADNLIVTKLNGQPVFGGYEAVNSNTSGYASMNPSAQGWYEIVNGQMVATTDTTVDVSKAYYTTSSSVALYDQSYIDGLESDLNDRIDGAIETYSGTAIPTLTNYPYTDWYNTTTNPVTDNRAEHVGDLYYVVNASADEDGYCYRFYYDSTQQSYRWVLIKDSDVTRALSDISDLQTFESETSTWIEETDDGLSTIRTNHTTLSGRVDATVKASVQLWFTKANTTAPSKPTAQVTTNNASTANAWNLAVPTYNVNYPNYFYCWQYQYSNNTYGWSAVIRDTAMGESQERARTAVANAATAQSTADTALAGAVEYVVGTHGTTATNAWTGTTRETSLVAGKTIAFKMTSAGTSTAATLNLTLEGGGTTGAKALRRNDSTVTTQFAVNSVLQMTYDGTYWRVTGLGSDTNNYDRTAYKASATASAAIAAGRVAVFGTDGKLMLLSNSAFDVTMPILYVGTAYTASALTQTNNYTFWGSPFALTNTHVITGAAAGKAVYVVGTLAGTTFTPTSAVLTCAVPNTEDGYYYIRLGMMSTAANAVLEAEHPFYAYQNGSFQRVDLAGIGLAGVAQAAANTAQSTANANIKSSVMLWFTKANATAPSKPTAVVTTNNASTGNAWNLAVPTYNSSYKYYFYCYQQQKGDGTYQWTDVVYDRATTETQSTSRAASSSIASYITSNDQAIESLQGQIDGAVDIWYGTVDPTASNAPASSWSTTDDKDVHVGDMYINTADGHSFRYVKSGSTYSWTQIPESDASAALAAAQDAQATADGKRTVFTSTPTVPYDVGDLWVDGSTVKYATGSRSSGNYTAADWSLTATDDTAANAAQTTANANAKTTVQLWFSKANETAPAKPTAHVTSTATTGNAWTTVVPAYNSSYPYYFYCYEYLKGDGTYAWSSVVNDKATAEVQSIGRDAQTKANANIKSSVMLWYTSNSTTPPSAPTSQVTSTSTSSGTWTLVVPTYSSSTPRYHYCYQQQKGDGTYQWTTPVYDKGTSEAMVTAKAALPASTFTTFESSTFKDVKDTVDEQSTTITQLTTRVDNIQIGGRNLLLRTSAGFSYAVNTTEYVTHHLYSTGTSDTAYDGPQLSEYVSTGDDVTLSFDWSTSANGSNDITYGRFRVEFYGEKSNGTNGYISVFGTTVSMSSSNNSGHYAQTVSTNSNTIKANRLVIRCDASVLTLTISNVKLETGNKPTDWTPAPEDMATAAEVTTVSNTVNSVSQTATTNSSKISNLTTTLGTNADGTTSTNDIVHRASSLEQDLDGITTRVGKTEMHIAGTFATSSTAAGTAAKVATITPTISGWTLESGVTITVKFTTANTASAPTLNVNSTGAKAIRDHTGAALAESAYEWAAGTTYAFTYDGTYWRLQDSTLTSRVSQAETSITQNTDAIALRATKTEAYQVAQPNLSPYYSSVPYASTNTYWKSIPLDNGFTFTSMGDGWMRVQCTNSGSSVIKRNWYPIKCPSVRAGQPYTWLAEVRNNTSSSVSSGSDFYLVQTNNLQFWGQRAVKTIEGPSGSSVAVNLGTCGSAYTLRKVQNAETADDGHWTNNDEASIVGLACWTFRCAANSTIDYEVRLSIYEGEYTGPYKPYSGTQLYASQAELKVANDSISTKVSANGVISSINQSPESITIDAAKVNIAGAALFTSGRLSQSSLNSAYDTKGAAAAVQANIPTNVSDLTNDLSMAWQGTCSTAAGTAAKVVTCSGFALTNGSTVTVRFSTANTSTGAITLNVNSTGAKTIYVGGAATAAANQLLWAANAMITFTYDGTYWRVTSEPRSWYGTCTTAAATAAKASTVNEVVLCKGATVSLQMTNANSVANPTLNITSLGAKDIYTAGARPTATSEGNWTAASTVAFVFDGQYFRYDSDSATKASAAKSAAISAAASDATAKANAVQANLDNIQIGGRNLLKGSGTLSGSEWAKDLASAVSVDDGIATITKAASGNSQIYQMPANGYWSWTTGESYVVSIDAKSDTSGTAFTMNAVGAGSSKSFDATTDWQRYSFAFTCTNGGTGSMSFCNNGATGVVMQFRKPKLETGNKPTDWTPAPEDTDTAIDTAVKSVAQNWFATCSTAAGAQAKIATIAPETEDFTLKAGATVNVKFTNTNSYSATTSASVTLNINSTGAKNIFYGNSATPTGTNTTAFGRASYTNTYVYDGTYWVWVSSSADNNSTYNLGQNQYSSAIKAETAITAAHIICGTSAGYKHIAASATFDLSYPLLYATAAIAAAATATTTYLSYPGITYTTTGTITSGTAYSTIYLKGTVSGNAFTVAAAPFMTCTAATSVDGYFYIPLGTMTSATAGYFNSSKDLYAYIDGKFRQVTPTEVVAEQYIYRSSASGTSSMAKYETWVAAPASVTASTQNAWTTKRPEYSTSYPVLWVAKQTKRLDGTVTCTTPVKDDTTTIIDGGHITTGTIDASKATITNIDASNITTGTIAADRIKANVISAVNNGTGTIDADKINASSLSIGYSQLTNPPSIPSKTSDLTNDSNFVNTTQLATKFDSTANRVWYAECSTAADATVKVATISPTTTSFSLTAGQTVNVKFTNTNTAAVASLQLNVNSTGAKNMKYLSNGALANLPAVGYLKASQIVTFTYDGTYWVADFSYNSDTTNRTRWQNVVKAIATANSVTSGHIICGTASGYQNIAADVAFDLSYPLLYTGSTIAAASGTTDNTYLDINSITITNNGTVQGAAQYATVYLKGTLSGNTVTIAASNFLTCTVPQNTADGYVYIPLGMFYNSTSAIYFHSSKELWAYVDGAFGPVSVREASAAAKTATNYISADSTGIRIANANPATATTYQHQTATETEFFVNGTSHIWMGTSGNVAGLRVGTASQGNVYTSGNGYVDVRYGSYVMAHFGYSEGNDEDGTSTAPYYTLGTRRAGAAFNESTALYSVGSHVLYNGSDYVCIKTVTTAGPWTGDTNWRLSVGNRSLAEGTNTTASGGESHAEGYLTTAIGLGSHAEGRQTIASGNYSHTEGYLTTASSNYSHAEGYRTIASGNYSHTEGHLTTASSNYSHAEGYRTTVSGGYSHAEGHLTTVSGNYSHAEGTGAIASGDGSHAEGAQTTASGDYSHAQNQYTIAASDSQTAIGKFNVSDSSGDYAFIIGNGTAYNNRSNALAVKWDGTTTQYGGAVVIGAGGVNLKSNLIDRDGSAPTGDTINDNNTSFHFNDTSGDTIGRIRMQYLNTGVIRMQLLAWNEPVGGGDTVYNTFAVGVAKDGTASYSMTSPVNFRNAIGASSGIFPTSVGGTGITSNPSMLTNLGSTTAASVFAASPRPGVTGTLPRANGGTGMSARTTGTVTRTGITTDGSLLVYSNGVCCTLAGSGLKLKAELTNGSTVELANVPGGFCPPSTMYVPTASSNSTYQGKGTAYINSSGVLTLVNRSGSTWPTTASINFTITWAL